MRESDKNTRKRGDMLNESIYEATVEIIKEVGYANLTFQQIAQRAKTSRTVLYRRWNTTYDLIREIMVYKFNAALDGELIDKIEDTGSLRGDLLYLLTIYQRVYTYVGLEIMNALIFEMSQNNEKLDEVKINATEKNIITMRALLKLAKARGEQIKDVSNQTLSLPFDLIRMEYIMYNNVVDAERLKLLVDEILLPVFKA
ncbi:MULTISPECIES: TetR/AcrR family transcriptional regulator [Clostridium]|jgi:AcrR family transcriptional regulator|uniref:AcrR family transcriptional regulator n=2 Tax=Clostridium TaxID=1485 RepID=A0A0B5QED6_CLOBE|nr:TetR/AcrR family transcriptional regulator [Clostridium beijerinckii]AJH00615.1 TetR family transcriptional regulator [Clostridium beijerinckii]NRT92208.1 AcrR family transcriptional regulator [Clostridium beijerinckii]NYC71735.1 AcrR family transcriptional regulator [Clostridium beijerinckii]